MAASVSERGKKARAERRGSEESKDLTDRLEKHILIRQLFYFP